MIIKFKIKSGEKYYDDNVESDISMQEEEEAENSPPQRTVKKRKKKIDFIDERVVAALDACGISDPKAMHIISAVAIALGFDLNDLIISRSTLSRHRKKERKDLAAKIKDNFKVRNDRSAHIIHLKNILAHSKSSFRPKML